MSARHTANRGDGARAADGRDPPSPAALGDPYVAQGKVEADGIPRIDREERAGDLLGRLPVRRAPATEANEKADPPDVDVERDHEVRGVYTLPDAEIDTVVGPHDPAQEEVPAL